MSKTILSINAGSSSVKVSIYSLDTTQGESASPEELAQIQISGLTAPPATLTYSRHNEPTTLQGIAGPEEAFAKILNTLIEDKDFPTLTQPSDVHYACHRIVHGGDYSTPVRIDRDTYHHLEALSALAPLHNAGALAIARAVHEQCPTATNLAFFDSSFHATIPEARRTYAIDQKVAKRNKLRKYGFHGLSYAFITSAVASHLGKPVEQTNIIAMHLGSGCSIAAIQNGKSVDTSMGLTPLAGLPGATRSGDVDPSLIFHFTNHAGDLAPQSTREMHLTTAEQILNKQSGWKALTGTTDFGDISRRAAQGDEGCALATDLFVDRLVGYVGSYFVKLGGAVDALVFAGGIGEKSAEVRERVVGGVGCLGFGVDVGRNKGAKGGGVVEDIGVGGEGGGRRVLVVQTDEQREMVKECAGMIGKGEVK